MFDSWEVTTTDKKKRSIILTCTVSSSSSVCPKQLYTIQRWAKKRPLPLHAASACTVLDRGRGYMGHRPEFESNWRLVNKRLDHTAWLQLVTLTGERLAICLDRFRNETFKVIWLGRCKVCSRSQRFRYGKSAVGRFRYTEIDRVAADSE